ncbi:Spermidine/putrescine import ATP-binding protein PotA [Fundidesulfovibrio magnetotacticus]|uniref:Spermidine/putrescine import ATP-binding protein PotA n=1 Tax=Fundidesulfovibrio magnetotacticus TaxID=2730080 RepID=A0A6V8LNN5_9BACT|nr:ABC transporter ATP-binding protein [Fundidesulfovibrio magnetotacticus]GFK94212.1 Spermidine/putrescine import ATP-binding protein PotA [Fundidesulfovibrio magnetotacticus]
MGKVSLEGVSKGYGGRPVLEGLNLEVERGECFTLLGPSGCGKTVLLRLVAGFEAPDAGRVLLDGEPISDPAAGVDVPPDRRGLGVVFQDYAVWPHMTVEANVAYPLKLAKTPPAALRERVAEVIGHVNLTGLEDRLPSQLSGGQQQRVALARALAPRPSMLLLDEPLCNLDAHLREEMRFEIKELQRNLGITVLYVTHDQEIALAISDRLAVMDASGRIRQAGSPEAVYENPADSYVFRFLGMANFLPVALEDGAWRVNGRGPAVPFEPPADGLRERTAGFRPTDAELSRRGEGLEATVKRASFLGAQTDYLLDIDGVGARVQTPTHTALERDILFTEGERCRVNLRGLHWFGPEAREEVR